MPDTMTDDKLVAALRAAARRELDEDELRRQRVSFIMGSVGKDSGVTHAQVERLLDRQDGRKPA